MILQLAVMGAGVAGEIVAWRLVARGRHSVWRVMTPTFVALGAAAVLAREPIAAARVGHPASAIGGALAGVLLYAATRVFVAVASAWPPFREGTFAVYGLAGDVPAATAAILACIMAVGEELFWRGLVQARLAGVGPLAGAGATWLAFIAVNTASGSLPLVAGAVVGGAVWAALAWWTGGILASVLCHVVWTALMILGPPRVAAAPAT